MTTKSTWHTGTEITPSHKNIEIRQIYNWMITEDNKVAIVSKDNTSWQFPGGKPKEDETPNETIEREIREETGLEMSSFNSEPIFFGYYMIEPNDDQNSKFLQLRYILEVENSSTNLTLSPNENPADLDPIISAKFVPIESLADHIPWVKGLNEYEEILDMMNNRKQS